MHVLLKLGETKIKMKLVLLMHSMQIEVTSSQRISASFLLTKNFTITVYLHHFLLCYILLGLCFVLT